MIVRCTSTKDTPSVDNSTASDWLRIGSCYTVFGIFISPRLGVLYRILGEYDRTPILLPSVLFEIIDSQISEEWSIVSLGRNELSIGPVATNNPGFWELYYDDDLTAIEIFAGIVANTK